MKFVPGTCIRIRKHIRVRKMIFLVLDVEDVNRVTFLREDGLVGRTSFQNDLWEVVE